MRRRARERATGAVMGAHINNRVACAVALTVLLAATGLWVAAQNQVQVGYAVLLPDAGVSLPVGSALFSYSNSSGVLVSEAGVGAAEPIRTGRIFVDEEGARTGFAIVNANPAPASVTLVLRDDGGREAGQTSVTLSSGQHKAQFVSELFPARPAGFTIGSLTFESNQELSCITLRESRNAYQEPIYSTLPVTSLDVPPGSAPLVLPHLAVGGGYSSELVLVNTSANRSRGRVRFLRSNGQPLALNLSGSSLSDAAIDIEPHGVYRAHLDGLSGGVESGYAVVTPDAESSTPAGSAIFRFTVNGALVSEAGVIGVTARSAKIFVDYAGTQTGLAVVNSGSQPATIDFTLSDRFGNAGSTTRRVLPPQQHLAILAHELFPEIPDGFTGVMDIVSSADLVAVTLKLSVNARNDLLLTTLPVADVARSTASRQIVFPHIAFGSGFSTKLISLNPTQSTLRGTTNFYASDGTRLNVALEGQTGGAFPYQLSPGAVRRYLPGNAARLAAMFFVDSSGRPTTEVVVNEGGSISAGIAALDTAGNLRDDFDPVWVSLDTTVATVSRGQVRGNAAGFSTLTVTTGGLVTNATITVARVGSGTTGFVITGVVRDRAQRLYLAAADDHVVFLAQSLNQTPQVYAGKRNAPGLKNDLRLESNFRGPSFLAINQWDGSLYVSDSANHVIRHILPGASGRVETFAGTGSPGGADGPLSTATFNSPRGIAFDDRGNLWVVDSANHSIRKIDLIGRVVTTVAGASGLSGFTDGQGSTARFQSPTGIAFESEPEALRIDRERRGDPPRPAQMVVADTGNGVIRRVYENGKVETVEDNTTTASVAGRFGQRVSASGADKSPARFNSPAGVSVDPSGNIFVTEPNKGNVRAILQSGGIVDAAQSRTFNTPRGVVVADGKVVVTDDGRGPSEIQYAAPVITSATPNRVPYGDGSRLTIKGRNFAQDTIVLIGGNLATFARPSDTQTLSFTIPALPSGRTTITLRHRGGIAQTAFLIDAVPYASLQPGYITTIAGGSTFAGDGQVATTATLDKPAALAFDKAGNLFIADLFNFRIRRVSAGTGVITTVAGNGLNGNSGDGRLANTAYIGSPLGIAIDAGDNLYFTSGTFVRKVSSATGVISTIAGGPGYGSSGDNGLAVNATLQRPWGIAVDSSFNVYIADSDAHRVRVVSGATAVITTVAGTGQQGYSGDNGPATSASLNIPDGIALDRAGNLYIADSFNHRIRRVDTRTGIITTVAGNGGLGTAGDGGPATAATLNDPRSVDIDSAGNLWIADGAASMIRRVDAVSNVISTVAGTGQRDFTGDGGPAIRATLAVPYGVAVDAAGNVLIADLENDRVRRVTSTSGLIATVAGSTDASRGGDGENATLAELKKPGRMTFDANENLLVVDELGMRVRKIDKFTGIISTFAGKGILGFAGDNGPAGAAIFSYPNGITTDRAGNVFIADSFNNRVRKVSRVNLTITTVCGTGVPGFSGDGGPGLQARLYVPYGLATDSADNLFIVDSYNHRVRRLEASTGIITTVAGNGLAGFIGDGGPAASGALNTPGGVAVDNAGNLYIADTANHRIRRVSNGTIMTVAGNGTPGYSGDGGIGTAASLQFPTDVKVDPRGFLWIADYFNGRVRRLRLDTGVITTVAGSNTYNADNRPALQTGLYGPVAILIDSVGDLFIAELYGGRIRIVRAPIP